MIYSDFHGKKLSLLGFGTMRLPLIPGGTAADIDQEQVDKMVAYAIGHGVNYFDTAYPYHGSMSEIAIGKALSAYPRDSFFLADKFPGHQIASSYDPAGVFEDQLRKCGVDYFDFYLMHNVNEHSIRTYKDEKWHIVEYFIEQKRLGRIKHLGFSCHGSVENIREFLDAFGEHMEFCQIQLNYLDWSLQDAKGKYALLTQRGIPVWVMEPVRGGKLVRLPAADAERLAALHLSVGTSEDRGFSHPVGLAKAHKVAVCSQAPISGIYAESYGGGGMAHHHGLGAERGSAAAKGWFVDYLVLDEVLLCHDSA